nr:16S rRNA (cytidine(1402)-2'-O)-methyltransferase [Propionibacteriales bacterium]
APHRTAQTLAAMAAAFGPGRPGAVCRELTKAHEEVRRGSLAELVGWAADGVRGEVTLVVSGAADAPATGLDEAELRGLVDAAVAGGATRKDAVAAVANELGIPKKTVYAAAHSN